MRYGITYGMRYGSRYGTDPTDGAPAAPPPVVQAVGTFLGNVADVSPSPPGHIAGDKLILVVEWSGATPVPAPTNWTQVVNSPQVQSTVTGLGVYWRDAADGSTPAPTVALSGNNHVWAGIISVRGAAAGAPEATAGATSGGSGLVVATYPSVDTAGANRLILGFCTWSVDDDQPQGSNYQNPLLLDVFEVFDGGTTQGNGGGAMAFRATRAVAGSTGASTCDLATATLYGAITLAIRSP